MMYKLAFLCVLVASALADDAVDPDGKGLYTKKGKYKNMVPKGPCDQTMECAKKELGGAKPAACLGYYSCFKADLSTKNNIKCIGSAACQKAKFYGNSKNVICSGYRSCEAAKGGAFSKNGYDLESRIKVSCDGAFACNTLPNGIYSKKVKCDGDAACSNVQPVAMKDYIAAKQAAEEASQEFMDAMPVNMITIKADALIACNGKSVCRFNKLYSDKKVECDGDGACRQSKIEAQRLRCHGKRACESAKPIMVQELQAYGFMGAAQSFIRPKDTSQELKITSYGFNSLANAEIGVNKGSLKLIAYGWRGAFGAKVYCAAADCDIECWLNACKSMVIYYKNIDDDVTIEPSACHPSSPDYPEEKTDKEGNIKPGVRKYQGVFCPSYMKAAPTLTFEAFAEKGAPYPLELQAEIDEATKEMDEFNAAEDKAMNEYLTKLADDLQSEFETQLIEDIDNEQAQQLFAEGIVIQSLQQNNVSSSLIVSNMITAVLSMLAFFAAIYYYPQCQLAKKGEVSPLLP